MSTPFEKYSDILLEAYLSNDRADDLATKKKEILDDLFGFFPTHPVDVLFVGFSPSLLKVTKQKIHVTQISKTVNNYLTEQGVAYTYIDFDSLTPTKDFCAVVAVDEYFTFAETDVEQRTMVDQLVGLTNGFIITTLKDYKNQDYREKEFSYPVLVRGNKNKKIFFEQYEYSHVDRNVCVGTNYVVDDDSVMVVGPFNRRAMFFKQLAKFSLDAGARNFLVHKNLMYKSIIKKNYEHIITIQL